MGQLKHLRARAFSLDRVAEAEYFLRLLRTASVDSDEFRYLCSAAITAIRSIPLVLQKDLRHKVSGFDEWFEERKRSADAPRFRSLAALRNTIQKEGNEYPLLRYSASLEGTPVTFVHLTYCAADATRPLRSIDLQLDRWHELTPAVFRTPRTGEQPLTAEELDAAVDLLSETTLARHRFTLSGVIEDSQPGTVALSPDVFLQRLEDILCEQRELVMQAMLEFGVLSEPEPLPPTDFASLRVIC